MPSSLPSTTPPLPPVHPEKYAKSIDDTMLKRKKNAGGGMFLTESFLQGLYVATLRTALPSLLVVGTVMSQAGAGAAAGSNAVALEFALPANHAGKALGLGDAGVVRVRIARRHVVVLRRAVARVVPAVARRAVVRGAGHGAGWENGDCAGSAVSGRVVMILGSTVGVYSSPLAGFPNFCNANLLHAGRTDDWWADEQKREKEMKKREQTKRKRKACRTGAGGG